jgi:hypothetical protein
VFVRIVLRAVRKVMVTSRRGGASWLMQSSTCLL